MRNLAYQAYLNSRMAYDRLLWDSYSERKEGRVEAPGGGMVAFHEDSPWDQDMLGTAVRKVTQVFYREGAGPAEAGAVAQKLDGELRAQGAGFSVARLSFDCFPLIGALESQGWFLGDALNIYHADLEAFPQKAAPEDADLREPSWAEVDKLFPDPARYFTHSRILRDPRMPAGTGSRFFATLLRQTFAGKTAIKSGIYQQGELAGFAVGDRDTGLGGQVPGGLGFLWLIAIRPEWAGQGLSAPLLADFMARMGRACRHIEIGTQVDNLPANRLYQRAGLRLAANTVTLHRWFKP
jgi:ribosomal protein S18 acetylase RimI-like enzyme